jgi:hypothetical protein
VESLTSETENGEEKWKERKQDPEQEADLSTLMLPKRRSCARGG